MQNNEKNCFMQKKYLDGSMNNCCVNRGLLWGRSMGTWEAGRPYFSFMSSMVFGFLNIFC